MNEFEEKDYAGARSYADAVRTNADNIMGIFNDSARDRYNQIRKNYEVFYEKVIAMKNHIYSVTAANEQADDAASQTIANV